MGSYLERHVKQRARKQNLERSLGRPSQVSQTICVLPTLLCEPVRNVPSHLNTAGQVHNTRRKSAPSRASKAYPPQ